MWGNISLWFWFAISMMISNVEFLFMYLSAICTSSLGKSLFKCSVHFLLGGLFLFLLLIIWIIYRFWILTSLSDIWFENIFFHPMGCLITWLIMSFDIQKFLQNFWWTRVYLFFSLFCRLCFWCPYQSNHCWIQCCEVFTYVFF